MPNEIDAIIDAAETVSPAQETTDAPKETPEEQPETDTPEPEQAEVEIKERPEEMFPKKAVNALSRRDKQIGKLKAEKQQMQQELEALRIKGVPKTEVKDDSPKEENFATYGEYLRAEARFAAKQELNEVQSKQQTETAKTEAQEWETERQEAIDENHQEALKAFPDLPELVAKNVDANGKIPLSPDARRALLESDNGAFALRQILKDGLLSDLNEMSPAKAAMLVARMEDKGLAQSKIKSVSKAPTPMMPSKGNASSGGKAEDELINDILAYVKK